MKNLKESNKILPRGFYSEECEEYELPESMINLCNGLAALGQSNVSVYPNEVYFVFSISKYLKKISGVDARKFGATVETWNNQMHFFLFPLEGYLETAKQSFDKEGILYQDAEGYRRGKPVPGIKGIVDLYEWLSKYGVDPNTINVVLDLDNGVQYVGIDLK